MDWVYYLLLLVVQIAGLAVALFQMPGLWLMLAGTGVYAWVTAGRAYLTWRSLLLLFLLALLAEIVELVAGSAGAKKAGASKLAMFGAVVGGFIGAIAGTFIPIPILGTIIGACSGSFLGAMLIEWWKKGELHHSLRVGVGAFKGRAMGIAGKLTIGVAMLLVTMCVAIPLKCNSNAPIAPVVPPVLLLPTSAPATVPTTAP